MCFLKQHTFRHKQVKTIHTHVHKIIYGYAQTFLTISVRHTSILGKRSVTLQITVTACQRPLSNQFHSQLSTRWSHILEQTNQPFDDGHFGILANRTLTSISQLFAIDGQNHVRIIAMDLSDVDDRNNDAFEYQHLQAEHFLHFSNVSEGEMFRISVNT